MIDALKSSAFFGDKFDCEPVVIEDIHRIESLLSIKLPDSIIQYYLEINGCSVPSEMYRYDDDDYTPSHEIIDYMRDLNSMYGYWKEMNEMNRDWTADGMNDIQNPVANVLKGNMKPYFWTHQWIPFARAYGADFCLDFDPDEGGVLGQVIYRDVTGEEYQVVASSFSDFLEKYFLNNKV